MAFIIIFKKYYFRIIIKIFTKCNILSTFAHKNYGKFAYHNLEKLCSRPLVLASTIPVIGLERSVHEKLVLDLGLGFFFESLALNVGFSNPPLVVFILIMCLHQLSLSCSYTPRYFTQSLQSISPPSIIINHEVSILLW